mmetsp:Transcript_25225/g.58652  ORF Transcript_25225/g.58652 Transcript_25225/m.58652 type:complete len:94 (-) Transcript_25225:413-694(-)
MAVLNPWRRSESRTLCRSVRWDAMVRRCDGKGEVGWVEMAVESVVDRRMIPGTQIRRPGSSTGYQLPTVASVGSEVRREDRRSIGQCPSEKST